MLVPVWGVGHDMARFFRPRTGQLAPERVGGGVGGGGCGVSSACVGCQSLHGSLYDWYQP